MGAVHICNLYSLTRGQQAIREAFRAMTDRTGNLPSLPGMFLDQMAPVIRNGDDGEKQDPPAAPPEMSLALLL